MNRKRCVPWGATASLLLLLGWGAASAQEEPPQLNDLLQNLGEWAQEHLDTNVLQELPALDGAQAREFLRDLQQQFQGEYILNLAALRGVAEIALPLLDQHQETQAVAIWLRSRMDYFQVAQELSFTIPPPAPEPNRTNVPPPAPNPSAARQREVWVKTLTPRPWPPAASNYVTALKPSFAAQKVPPEFIWIAEVESSFDPRARSPVGARGLFQLMPETAKRFGLSLWPRDQRIQPGPSATAAAKYLNYLHHRFKDWRLALAAYNAGEGTVQRLLKKHTAKTYDDIAPYLPAETQMYVPKVEAVIARREGLSLAQLPN